MSHFASGAASQFSRPTNPEDWNSRKEVILDLYASKPLREVMTIMAEEHHFKATENQYKKRLSAWDTQPKRIGDGTYYAILRKTRERENVGKDSAFQLGEMDIDDSKIMRFKSRTNIGDDDDLPDAPSPPDLICITPPPTNQKSHDSMGIHYFSLLPFEWYSTFGDFINWSAVGPSAAQFGTVSGLLRSFVILVDNYETEAQNIDMIRNLGHICCSECQCLNTLDFVTNMVDKDQMKAHGLVGTFVRSYLREIDGPASPLPANGSVINHIAHICHVYTAIGRANESMGALETLIASVVSKLNTVGLDPDCSEESFSWYNSLRICSIELAFGVAVSGYEERATKMMNNSLGLPIDADTVHLIASLDGACEGCIDKTLHEAQNRTFKLDKRHALANITQVWATATKVAVMMKSRRVNIDREPITCGLQYDPLLTEGADWHDEEPCMN